MKHSSVAAQVRAQVRAELSAQAAEILDLCTQANSPRAIEFLRAGLSVDQVRAALGQQVPTKKTEEMSWERAHAAARLQSKHGIQEDI